MGGCTIKKCPNSRLNQAKGVALFRIPSGKNDLKRRGEWLIAAKRTESEIHSGSRVCEHHFGPNDWEKVREDGTRKLKSTAVPSLNLHPSTSGRTALGNITNSSVFNSNVPTSTAVTNLNLHSTTSARTPLQNITNSKVPNSNASSVVRTIIDSGVQHSSSTIFHDHSYTSKSTVDSFACSTPVRKVSQRQGLPINSADHPINCSPIPMNINVAVDMCSASDSGSILEHSAVSTNHLEETCSDINVSVNVSVSDPSGEPHKNSEEDTHTVISRTEDISAFILKIQKENEMLRAKASATEKLTKEVFSLRAKLTQERKAKYRIQNKLDLTQRNISKSLTPDQLNAIARNSTRGMKRTPAALSEGLYFKSQCGNSAYSDIAKRFHLPAIRTLSSRTQHVKFKSGILKEVFGQLTAVASTLSEQEKDCHLCFDEMALEPNDKLYDPSTKEGIGQCTLPGHSGIASKSLTVMLSGVGFRWKLVVAHYYSGNRDGKQGKDAAAHGLWNVLKEIIENAENAGVKVNSLSSDMGAENRALWKILGVKGKRSGGVKGSIPHPYNPSRILHILPDVPHLFKNIVHMLHKNKFIELSPDVVKSQDLPTNVVSWDHIKQLMEHEKNCELKIAFRLQEDTMKSGHFEKMQVGRAKAIFNNRTAAGLRIMADKYNKPELKTTAWFISLVVRWFELLSSRSHACALSLANREAYSKATEHIQLTSTVFQTMKIGTKGDWKPCQEGLIIACHSIINLQQYYLFERGYKFLLTSRFSQDCLENLFSQIRRRNSTPNALLFKNILRSICLSGKTCRPPRGHCYDYDDGDMLVSVLLNWREDESTSCPPDSDTLNLVHCPTIMDSDVYEIVDDWELMPIYDMAGAALHKAMEVHKIKRDCPCVQSLCWQGPGHHPCSAAVIEKNYIPGALVEVSDKCFNAIAKCELIFRILRTPLLKEKAADVIEEISKRAMYVWDDIQCPPCHKDLKLKVMKRYIMMRWKQYGQNGKKDLAEAAAIFSSKCLARSRFVKNIHV